MRLVAAGILVASLLTVTMLPAAQADCRISIRDPTDPYFTEDCTDTSYIKDFVNGTATTQIEATSEQVVQAVDQETGICDAGVPCGSLFEANLTVTMDTTGEGEPLKVDADLWTAGEESQAEWTSNSCHVVVAGGLGGLDPCSGD